MIPVWRKQYVQPGRDEDLGWISGLDASDGAQLGDGTTNVDMAVQSFKDDSNINVLLRRFGVTGQLPIASSSPFYGDFSEVGTYQDALNMVLEADQAFQTLPSKIRNRFRNDPAELIAFLEDDTNRAEAEQLGLVKPPPPATEPQVIPLTP